MRRYLSSFIISSLFYVAILGVMFYLFSKNDYATKKVQKENEKRVQFCIVSPPKVEEIKPITKKKEKPKPKPKKKKEPKPKPKPKPKPIVKPTPITEEPIVIPKAPVIEEIVEEEEVKEPIEEEVLQTKSVSNVQKRINQDIKKAKQKEFINYLIKRINSNKSYPNMARRRGIEGEVEAKFKILANGEVEEIQIVSGRSIFKKATIQAIERSFPVEVDSSLFDFPEVFKIKIAYILK